MPIINIIIPVLFLMAALLSSDCNRAPSGAENIYLPQSIGEWAMTSHKTFTEDDIFDYMDGAGEIYLGYQFNGLDVYEYTSPAGENIIVEIYGMASSGDAFGLLSLDWGGEPVDLSGAGDIAEVVPQVPSARALYGLGLLRLWSDTVYARVMAYLETEASREAVLELGRIILANRKLAARPAFLEYVPPEILPEWKLIKERVHYLRSYLVLNSLFFVSSHNILNLDLSAEVALATYGTSGEPGQNARMQAVLIRYESRDMAGLAAKSFLEAFVPDRISPDFQREEGRNYAFEIEDGWMGCFQDDAFLIILFNCPAEDIVWNALESIKLHIGKSETRNKPGQM